MKRLKRADGFALIAALVAVALLTVLLAVYAACTKDLQLQAQIDQGRAIRKNLRKSAEAWALLHPEKQGAVHELDTTSMGLDEAKLIVRVQPEGVSVTGGFDLGRRRVQFGPPAGDEAGEHGSRGVQRP
jgi:type II secretory pathway component PulK